MPTTSRPLIDFRWETARTAGAVAICRLSSSDVGVLDQTLCDLTGKARHPVGTISHGQFAAIDDGVIVRLSETTALLMPHGGPRITARIDGWLKAHGVVECAREDGSEFPEASSRCEALALQTMATAASPRAIGLLLAHSRRIDAAGGAGWKATATTAARDARLAHLIHPPRIVAVGAANVGKSSLLNALAGRTVAIAMDLAGTTRDAVAARLELDGLVADWFDTPGIREAADPVERAAQAIAGTLRDGAQLILEVSAPGHPCPRIDGGAVRLNECETVARLKVCTRIDLDPSHASPEARAATVRVSATQRTGLDQLAIAVRRALVSDEDLASELPWVFHPALITAS